MQHAVARLVKKELDRLFRLEVISEDIKDNFAHLTLSPLSSGFIPLNQEKYDYLSDGADCNAINNQTSGRF